MRIKRLPDEVVQKIAAGEVVDRPASVLKELLENSIDAGATRMRVELERGGIARLLVADNGCGMTPEEMHLAIERHTTSKISGEEDLRHLKTLGFRGEALAAICAVSKTRLISRTQEAASGYELLVEAGKIMEGKPAPHPVGTTVEVRDLFFNVPARRKFIFCAGRGGPPFPGTPPPPGPGPISIAAFRRFPRTVKSWKSLRQTLPFCVLGKSTGRL
jgi:DNA mismatch repair protein MutL